jgi:hypothetical protein
MATSAMAEGTPSSKATFGADEVVAISQGQVTVGSTETAWMDVIERDLKTANNKDLIIIPSLQCGVVTDGTVKSKGGTSNSTTTRGRIRVRVKVEMADGTVRYASPQNSSDALGVSVEGVTYCDREQTLAAKFAGLNCTANLTTGAVTCADPEELQLILKTLNANTFVFGIDDVQSGVTTVTVQAKALASVALTGADGSLGSSNAFIGAGSVSVEEVRFVKDLEIDL